MPYTKIYKELYFFADSDKVPGICKIMFCSEFIFLTLILDL